MIRSNPVMAPAAMAGILLAAVGCGEGGSFAGPGRVVVDGGAGSGGMGGGGGASAGDVPPICTREGWCWESPLPVGSDLRAVWASADDDVWVVVADGELLHWDGARWQARDFGAATFTSIWGAARDDVWVGGAGLLHFDGSEWAPVDVPTTEVIWDLHGAGAADVWAVGNRGTVLHFDGVAWTVVDAGSDVHLTGVWATGPRDVWAVGGHTMLHYDGAGWSATESNPDVILRGLWGSGSADVWIFAAQLAFPFAASLFRFDGTAWTEVLGETARDVWRIVGTTPDDVWTLGQGIDHFDGRTWTRLSNDGTFLGGWPLGRASVWAAGRAGKISRWNGTNWSYAAPQVTPNRLCLGLSSLWAAAANDVWAVGGWGTIVHSDGRAWTVAAGGCAANDNTMLARVFGTAADDVWTVGVDDHGAGAARRFDGKAWRAIDLPAGTLALGAVWGSRADDVWLVGRANRLHWNGTTFASFPVDGAADPVTGLAPELGAMWGLAPDDVWAAGKRGMVAHWDGTRWTATHVPARFDYDFDAIWGSAADDIWVSGASGSHQIGALLHWNGRIWQETLGGTSRSSVWGASRNDVWASGCDQDDCAFHHWDGSNWRRLGGKPAPGGLSMFGLAGGDIWAVGGDVILHRRP